VSEHEFLMPSTCGGAIAAALRTTAVGIAKQWVMEDLPNLPMDVVNALVGMPSEATSLRRIARILQKSEAILEQTLHDSCVRSCERLAMSVRLVLGGLLVYSGVASVREAARLSGFKTSQAFCNALHRYTGQRPLQLRSLAGLETVRLQFTIGSRSGFHRIGDTMPVAE
jgi:AraC-like DNA-binding protein